MVDSKRITSPDDPLLNELCAELRQRADDVDKHGTWPSESLALCGQYGVYEWFLPHTWGGQDWSDVDVIRGYLRLSAACLTTTFIITQRTGACRRMAASENSAPAEHYLSRLLTAEAFATVGISHLTTSRRHLKKPVLRAEQLSDGGFQLDGFSPWVTGGMHADVVVTGATMDDGRQILAALPMDLPGIEPKPPTELAGVSASHTGAVECHQVQVEAKWLLFGPVENIMQQGVGAKTGGLQTSTLAIGLADSAIEYLENEAAVRDDLSQPADALRAEHAQLEADLLATAAGSDACDHQDLRARANSLALRAAHASLAAAKGTGYVNGHCTSRWCREALFFLVWSCPQPVMASQLCELAGISD